MTPETLNIFDPPSKTSFLHVGSSVFSEIHTRTPDAPLSNPLIYLNDVLWNELLRI
jgi:hypothetical protein